MMSYRVQCLVSCQYNPSVFEYAALNGDEPGDLPTYDA